MSMMARDTTDAPPCHGPDLRFWNPATGEWLLTVQEQAHRDRMGRMRAETAVEQRQKEFRALRMELDEVKRKLGQ
jgi:hypothetical protein